MIVWAASPVRHKTVDEDLGLCRNRPGREPAQAMGLREYLALAQRLFALTRPLPPRRRPPSPSARPLSRFLWPPLLEPALPAAAPAVSLYTQSQSYTATLSMYSQSATQRHPLHRCRDLRITLSTAFTSSRSPPASDSFLSPFTPVLSILASRIGVL